MVAVARLHEMKYSEARQSAEILWPSETFGNRFWCQFQVYYKQINIIRSRLIWTSWRPPLKIWAYRLKFLGVFTVGEHLPVIQPCWQRRSGNEARSDTASWLQSLPSQFSTTTSHDRRQSVWICLPFSRFSFLPTRRLHK